MTSNSPRTPDSRVPTPGEQSFEPDFIHPEGLTVPNGALTGAPLSAKARLQADTLRERTLSNGTSWVSLGRSKKNGVVERISFSALVLLALCALCVGLALKLPLLVLAAAGVAVLLSLRLFWVPLKPIVIELADDQETALFIAGLGLLAGGAAIFTTLGGDRWLGKLFANANWDAIGALGEVGGALGQILIAVLAVYIAWRQYVISKDLTIQQNTITQQQTIDTYFQGISDLVLDEEGLLEDWPQERAIAEGRTASILSSVDSSGKAKIIRFLSRARLLTPLRRDRRLGRAILDGTGGYEEDRLHGVRVIDLGVMLAGADLAGTDLRWTDLSEVNLIRADLTGCDLVKANLSRTVLVDAQLSGADLNGTRFFYGKLDSATPRSRTEAPNYATGERTGAVVEGADLSGAAQISPEARCYCCAWGGSKTRATMPGGCEGIPNQLGR